MKKKTPPKPQVVYEPLREWDPVKASEKLTEMYNDVIQTAGETIIWYHERRKTKGWWARALRLSSITLLVGSTIIPYLAAFNSNDGKILYIGYIMAGLGGGFLLFDQYYGLSNSWIRFVVTGMDLHNARTAFIKNWQVMCFESYPLTKKTFGVMVDSLLKFQDMFNGIVRAETAQWAKEFQQNFKELIEAMNQQRDKLAHDIEENRQARKKIEDEKTGNGHQAGTLEKVPDWVIDEAVKTKGEEWKKQYAAEAIFAGKKTVEDSTKPIYAVVIQPEQKIEKPDETIAVPPVINYQASDGIKYGLPTDIQPTGGKIYASGACDVSEVKQPGCSVSRVSNKTSAGTAGLKVFKGNKAYVLGCYHVLCGPELNDGQRQFKSENAVGLTNIVSPAIKDNKNDYPSVALGRVTNGLLSGEYDCAIALLEDDFLFVSQLCGSNADPNGILDVDQSHVDKHITLRSVGRTSGKMTGRLLSVNASCDINYMIGDEWTIVEMTGLICSDMESQGGDSGAPVYDKQNRIAGMIIANTESFTYILPAKKIFSKLAITLT